MRLIEKVWFHHHQAKYCLVPLLLPLTFLFWLVSSARRLAFRFGIKSSVKLTKPVVVVGNIGVGGNGKTPMVLWLVEQCQALGLTPGVISRGYGGKPPYTPYVIHDKSSVTETGDEALMIARRANVAVCVGSDRIASANALIEQSCDVIIADDGLQHYRLQRDIELIVVDGKRRFGNGLLLPAGPLREGLWRLNTVDYVFNNGDKPHTHEIPMRLLAANMVNCKTGEVVAIDELNKNGLKVNAIAGIGSPERFFSTLISQGFILLKNRGFIDHHAYCADDFKEFEQDIPLLMTEKDAIKCHGFSQDNWWYLTVDAHIPKQQQEHLLARITELASAANKK